MVRFAIRKNIEPSSLLGFARLVVGWLPAFDFFDGRLDRLGRIRP
jgi:hypothetical protein